MSAALHKAGATRGYWLVVRAAGPPFRQAPCPWSLQRQSGPAYPAALTHPQTSEAEASRAARNRSLLMIACRRGRQGGERELRTVAAFQSTQVERRAYRREKCALGQATGALQRGWEPCRRPFILVSIQSNPSSTFDLAPSPCTKLQKVWITHFFCRGLSGFISFTSQLKNGAASKSSKLHKNCTPEAIR